MLVMSGVKKTYNLGRKDEVQALRGVELTIADGEMLAIMGTSGAGKSTLLHLLACIDGIDSGTYEMDGESLLGKRDKFLSRVRNQKTGIVLQNFSLIEEYTVLQNVMVPLVFAKAKQKKQKALEALKIVGIQRLAGKMANEISGGEKQRVAIARSIVNQPQYIFADEPTGSLDSTTSAEIMGLFLKLNEMGKTVVVVTHDLQIARQCKRIITIQDGSVSEQTAYSN